MRPEYVPEYVPEYLEGFLVEVDSRSNAVLNPFIAANDMGMYHDVIRELDALQTEFQDRLYGLRGYMISAAAPISVSVLIEQAKDSVFQIFVKYMDFALQHQKQLIKASSNLSEFSPTSEAVETVLLPPENPDLEQPVEPFQAVVSLVDCPLCSGTGVQGEFSDYRECNYCAGSGVSPESEILPFSPFPSDRADNGDIDTIVPCPACYKRRLSFYDKSKEFVNV
ncbi:hypothetical protein [Methylomonas methanica]|uniref:Uncharacterized protein n=1 Tax=Methylomonas methanica (strain DSM 25384 / MC09) TaxID=857087 RepID=G0A219_METMM|nr:hypothetical protein [Methylomonas methanica]AEG02562.1 hypothetical protein Metme_4211 [Methylomonas methanica MC09]